MGLCVGRSGGVGSEGFGSEGVRSEGLGGDSEEVIIQKGLYCKFKEDL